MILFIFLLILFSKVVIVFTITTIYLNSSQIADGNGSLANPFKTFQSITNSLVAGSSNVIVVNDYQFINDGDNILLQDLPQNIR